MTSSTSQLSPCPMLINGEWSEYSDLPKAPVFNPSTGEVIAEAPLGGTAVVNEAVRAAREAFHEWSETPPVERARLFFRYRMLIEQNFDALTESVTREHGKTLSEARGSIQRGLENVEYACGIPSLMMADSLENLAHGIDCEIIRQPVGVCAGITPFNFPALVAMWMYPLAIACGNTFVLKPSEKVPLTAVRLIELLVEAGLPKGVLNLVHGGREAVDAILEHPDVDAISFVGSSPIAKYIYETGTRNGKRVQANGGAKNYILVMPDADMPKTIDGLVGGAYGCAGERCMASSTAVAVGKAADLLIPDLVSATRALVLGPTDRMPQPTLGPVITPKHRDHVNDLITAGESAGARKLTDGRGVVVPETPNGFYVGATLADHVQPGSALDADEVFGPVLNVIRMDNLDDAIELANRSSYGNGTAIYTRSGKTARELKHRVQAGMVGINVAVPASMAMFPFSGWKNSFYGDLHIQGKDGVAFYTKVKTVTSRWFAEGEGDIWSK